MNLTHFYPYMQALNATPNTTIPQHTMPSQIHYHQQQQQQQQQQRDTNTMGLSAQSNKRSSDLHDKEDSKSHSTRLESRITKHSLHNYGLAMDIYDAIARTLIPYVEYNERFKLKFMKQIHLDTTVTTFSGFPNIAQHIRTHLKMLCDEYSSNINGIVEIKSSVITNPTSKTDLIGGTPSIYLQNSHHGKIIQIIANILGIEICLVTSYIYEEMISVQPEDVLEKEPLYIAYNDVSKQYYMVDKPVDIRRNELSNHLHHLEQLIQKYHLTVIPKCSIGLSLFSATAQSLKNISIKNPMAENGIKKYFNMDSMFENELAILLRDMTYKQLKSNFDYYEAYVETKTKYFDIRRDSRSLIDCNYYRYQLEKVVLYALAHVIQCNMIVFNSDVKQSKPDVVRVDILIKDSSGIIILLKNESTQHYDSAIPNNSLRNLIGMTASKEPSVTENHHMNQSSEKTSTSNKPSENDQIYESIDPLSQQSDISYPSDPSTNIDSYSRQLSVHDNNMRLKDTYGDATRSTNTNEKKVDGKNSFLSKTREKFVTAFNKVVENGNLPKKSPIYHSNDQSSNNNSFSPSQTTATCSVSKYIELHSSPKTDEYSTFAQTPLQSNNISSVKRPAIITETISRQQQQQQQKLPNNNSYQNTPPKNLSKSDIISLPQRQINRPINTQQGAPTSVRHSSDIRQATENTRSHLIPYKDRQRSRNNLNMSFKSTVKKGNVFNGVTLEDVDDSEETDFTNSLTDDDTVILREINPQNPDNRLKNNTPRAKSSSYHYDHDTLRKQQRSKFVNGDFIDEEEAANDIRRYDDVNSLLSEHDLTLTDQQQAEDEEDIYISTTDIAQRERKQLQLFVKDKINHFNQINSSSATKFSPNKDMKYLYDTGNGKKQNVNDLANTKLPKSRDQQRNEIPTTTGKESQNHETTQLHHRTKVDSVEKLINSSTTKNDSSSMHSNRESHLIDKDAVLEVLGQSDILQRDRHILMKVLKQEDLISKEWQRLVYLLEEYVNNPKREKKERGLHALTLMENLDRLGYDMLEIQSTSTNQKNNHFKAIAKSLLLTMEINDWLNDYICSILHITNGQDLNFTKHLRKLCTKEWQKHYDNYKKMWIDKYPNNNTKAFDFQNEIEKFRSEDYYRLDMCFLVNQALANAFGIPIYIIRGIREENPVETIKPLFIARSGVNIVLISSQKNDGHYDVAVLKGHPQTLKKHRNVTFDEKPEIRSFKADDEQIRPTGLPNASQTPTMNNLSTMRQPNNGLILNTGTQFYPQFTLPTTIYPFNNYFLQPYMPQMMPTPNNDVKLSPSLTRTTSPNPKHTNMNNSTTNTSLTVPTTMPMVLQTPAGLSTMSYGTPTPYMQLPPTQTTFMYNTGMHQSNVPTVSPGTFFYTTSPYSI